MFEFNHVDQRGTELECVVREPLILAVPDDHALAGETVPRIRDLDRMPFIMYSPSEARYFYDLTSTLFRAAEIAPSFVQHVSQVHTVLALVSAGMGVALVPDAARSLHVHGVTLRELQPVPRISAELHLIWRRGQDNPAFRVFRNFVLSKLLET